MVDFLKASASCSLQCRCPHLHRAQASGSVSTIALWGHSMGAATSLLYASGGGETLIRRLDLTSKPLLPCILSTNNTGSSVVLDSPFSTLEAVMAEVALEVGELPPYPTSGLPYLCWKYHRP